MYQLSILNNEIYKDSDDQWTACVKLGKVDSDNKYKKEIVDSLIRLLKPPACAAIRAQAARSLGNLKAEKAALDLIYILEKDLHSLPRAYAAGALAKSEHKAAIPKLIKTALRDPLKGPAMESIAALKILCKDETSPHFTEVQDIVKNFWELREVEFQDEEPTSSERYGEVPKDKPIRKEPGT